MRNHVLFTLVACLLLSLLAACSRPPDDVIQHAVEQNVKMQLVRSNPFADLNASKIESYRIVNSYPQEEWRVYEYEAKVHAVAAVFGSRSEKTLTFKGKEGIVKRGNEWQFLDIE